LASLIRRHNGTEYFFMAAVGAVLCFGVLLNCCGFFNVRYWLLFPLKKNSFTFRANIMSRRSFYSHEYNFYISIFFCLANPMSSSDAMLNPNHFIAAVLCWNAFKLLWDIGSYFYIFYRHLLCTFIFLNKDLVSDLCPIIFFHKKTGVYAFY
jgi:hypothetical protein